MPAAVIPQIVLSGVIAPLNGVWAGVAEIGITANAGQRALERLLPEADRRLLGLVDGSPAGPADGSFLGPLAAAVAHWVVFAALGLGWLWVTGRAGGRRAAE